MVPDAHQALITHQDFDLVQTIRGLDTRTAPEQSGVYIFSGMLICGCCGGRMTRKTNRAGGKEYHYYYCPTGKKRGCAHPIMLKENTLIECVTALLKAHVSSIVALEALLAGVDQESMNKALVAEYRSHIEENERSLATILEYKTRLYENLITGMITREEYTTYKAQYAHKADEIQDSLSILREKLAEALENRSERNRWITNFTQFSELNTIDRKALIHTVKHIRVIGKKELVISFTFEDEYEKAIQFLAAASRMAAGTAATASAPDEFRRVG